MKRFQQIPGTSRFQLVFTDPAELKVDTMGPKPINLALQVAVWMYLNNLHPEFLSWLHERNEPESISWAVQGGTGAEEGSYMAVIVVAISDPDTAFHFKLRWG